MSTVKDYLRWYRESGANSESMDTAELAVEYAKYCVSEESRELHAIRKEEITQQQAEIARLNARVAELEEDSFKNGMKDLLLQAMDSTSEMPMYPVELETEDGSFIKAVIAIKIQAVGVAK